MRPGTQRWRVARGTEDSDEIILHLNTPEELFQVKPADMLSGTGRLASGMDELVQELTARRLSPRLHATIVLPADQVRPDTEERMNQAIDRYCQLRLRQTDVAQRAQRREVLGALGIGLLLFAFGVVLSFYFNQSSLPTLLKLVFGDSLFLVIAWVGLWYPLDELIHYRRPLIRQKKVLIAIRDLPITVRSDRPPPRSGRR